ncbi:Bud site selection protein 6 [Diatrype stigma]|uniref:Bud site selection protein 6 n=1 Tax=Diatrype stigma TaxID=117547 RepID=A0AAN9YVR3_9PEZI
MFKLLETLTQWSRGTASDSQVSDVYVRLGYEFNMACRAFTAINVDTSDLGNVPENLRHILEATLSQEASTESLEKYLPRIRDIIINLLHGLKRKQQKLRQKQGREKEGGAASPEGIASRTMSTSTVGSNSTGLTSLLNEGLDNGYRSDSVRDSVGQGQAGPSGGSASPNRRLLPRDQSQASVNSEPSTLSSTTMQNMPVMPPYPGDETIPSGPPNPHINIDAFPPPPPPPPPKSQQSALAALQRGGDLERRASRRYSAYQISKHLGAPTNGVPMLPSQNTPIPNRGRGEVRESMRAVQVRESLKHNRNMSSQSRNVVESSPPARPPSKVPEETPTTTELPPPRTVTPPAESPEERYRPSATISGPLDTYPIGPIPDSPEKPKPAVVTSPESKPPELARPQTPPEKRQKNFATEQSPPLDKELTLFLQYKSKVKKFVLPEGYTDLSIGRLQLAFIEKFSWNTALNGSDLPEIYIQDPVSGVRHELEDLSDIKDRTVLALNVEPLDEVKKHIDDGLGTLKKAIEEVRQNVSDQGSSLQRVSDRQLETAKEMARMASAPAATVGETKVNGSTTGAKLNPSQLRELQTLRRDLAVLRQTYSNFQSDIESSMSSLRNKAANVKVAAAKVSVSGAEGDTGYTYVKTGRKQLNTDSDRLVTKVDDLQDLVEDLRKDVVNRGVRPLPRQLEDVSKDIQILTKELKQVEGYIKREKPIWTKIWEKELEDVCQGRDELKLMEDLMVDLQDDLEKASETFALVEQATKEQMKDSTPTARHFSKNLVNLGNSTDQSSAKEGVLGEVRALQPNHEDRLEAIERAEKLRQKELESRKDNPLTKELSKFVEEGKLKKSGGFEEVERARKAKDDRIRREVWERMNGILPEEPIGGELGEGEGEGEGEGVGVEEGEGEGEGEDTVDVDADVEEVPVDVEVPEGKGEE